MISETIINIDAIMPYVTWICAFIVIGIALFLLHNLGGLKIFSKHDNKMVNQFLDKFPLVSPEFMKKSAKLQNAENNQEIHENNKKIRNLEGRIEELEQNIRDIKNIEKQLQAILEELQKNG